MPRLSAFLSIIAFLFLTHLAVTSLHAEDIQGTEAIISIAEQKLALVKDGFLIARFPISTSRYGIGDSMGSYRTPLGRLRICDKIGSNLASGAVLKHREATGEVLSVNAPGRDPIVTRIMWLEGMDAQNKNAKARGIYIHGTPEENRLGKNVSYGCIRMRSMDVMMLYDVLPVGATVSIVAERLPSMPKATLKTPEPGVKSDASVVAKRAEPTSTVKSQIVAKRTVHTATPSSTTFHSAPLFTQPEGSGDNSHRIMRPDQMLRSSILNSGMPQATAQPSREAATAFTSPALSLHRTASRQD